MSARHGNRQKYENRNPIQRALIARFQRGVLECVRASRPRTILDLGCGEGYTLAALIDGGVDAECSGIDLDPAAVGVARARLPPAVELEARDALELADDARRFDLVIATEVLEHVVEPDRLLAVIERLSAAHVLLSVPWEPFFRGLNLVRGRHLGALGNDPEHVNLWGRRGFVDFVARRFDPVRTPPAFPWTLVLARRR